MSIRRWFWLPAVLALAADLLSKQLIFACLGLSPQVRPDDILDWASLCARLKTEGPSEQPSVGKRVWALLPPSAREAVVGATLGNALDASQQAEVLSALNTVMSQRDLLWYASPGDAASLSRLLPDEPQGVPEDRIEKINRLVLEMAYPRELSSRLLPHLKADPLLRERHAFLSPLLALQLERNTGGVFGVLRGKGELFMILTVVALGAVFWMLRKAQPGQRLLPLALGLVAAGAIGNLVDRVWFGYVRDFLYVEIINWPAFNIADSCICVAAGLLVIEIFRAEVREKREGKAVAKH
ncbi:MAG: signal peptidase II [Planctomycetes bacterium]|nr:signal peptidase II [Planctomycetota bacterium]